MPQFINALFVIVFLVMPAIPLSAQIFHSDPAMAEQLIPRPVGYDTLDGARMEFIYEQTDVDTVLSRAKTNSYILQVGRELTLYGDYMAYRVDSACNAMNWQVTHATFDSIFSLYPSGQMPDFLYDTRADLFKVHERYLFDVYLYEDSTAHFDWTLLPDTTTVCGYLCRKAEATFRGIGWTAWYAPDIPMSFGPWKLKGLPGLVLWAYDDKGTHDIKLISARRGNNSPIAFKRAGCFRMKRERVRKLMEKNKTSPASYKSLTGLSVSHADGNGNPRPLPVKRKFYVPYELE